ncbi:hypothetical protein GE061_019203 [Apolygus lucorum]|uniref:Uncharacterized protein n=1 Tax=Apolygus lucorum TaxID=248454 RepID=A0A8S9XAE4_APOLU|nr:hypothetical protein GE061_019203 [Apolygus lucorum]
MACSGWTTGPPRVKQRSFWHDEALRQYRSRQTQENVPYGGTPTGAFKSFDLTRTPPVDPTWTKSEPRIRHLKSPWWLSRLQNRRDGMLYANYLCGGTPAGSQLTRAVRRPRSFVRRRLALTSVQPSYSSPQAGYCGSPMDISSGSSPGYTQYNPPTYSPDYYSNTPPQCGYFQPFINFPPDTVGMACSSWRNSGPRVRQETSQRYKKWHQNRRNERLFENLKCGGTPTGLQALRPTRQPSSAIKRRLDLSSCAVDEAVDLPSNWTNSSGPWVREQKPQWYKDYNQNLRNRKLYENLKCGGTPTGSQACRSTRLPPSAAKRRLDLSSSQPSYSPPQYGSGGSMYYTPMDISPDYTQDNYSEGGAQSRCYQ